MVGTSIKCPHCGSFTAFSPVEIRGKGKTLDSTSDRQTTYASVAIDAVTFGAFFQQYAILDCEACGKRFVAAKSDDDRWVTVYPISQATVDEEIPEPIKSEFLEANLCFAVGAYRGCLLVCRTALIEMQREQKVSSIKDLIENGIITPMLHKQADQVRLWANTVGHEVVVNDISREDAEQLLAYVRILFDNIYVQPKKLAALSQKRKELTK